MKIDWQQLASMLLTHIEEWTDTQSVINLLLTWGYTEEELYYIGYESNEIAEAKEKE